VNDEKEQIVDEEELGLKSIRICRFGHGANCSSIGSVVDTLFASAVIGGAVLAAVLAAMKKEPITVIGDPTSASPDPSASERGADTDDGE
jgi:hypothetical protein